jgi:hypothetical protein
MTNYPFILSRTHDLTFPTGSGRDDRPDAFKLENLLPKTQEEKK